MPDTKITKMDKGEFAKADKALEDLIKVFAKHKLTIQEILLVYGNLGYTLGASIGGYKDKGPSVSELEHMYATKPTIDVAMMLSGITCTQWINDLDKVIEKIEKEKNE